MPALAAPAAPQGEKVLADFTKSRYAGKAEFEKKLKEYGIDENDVKSHLLFQLQAIEFTELRFNAETSNGNEADRAATPAAETTAPAKVDQKLDDWLKQIRAQTRIEFKKEAFQ